MLNKSDVTIDLKFKYLLIVELHFESSHLLRLIVSQVYLLAIEIRIEKDSQELQSERVNIGKNYSRKESQSESNRIEQIRNGRIKKEAWTNEN